MFDIGGGELLLILIFVLVAFGPKKIPELSRSLGRGIREFKKAQREFTDQINSAFAEEELRSQRMPRPANTIGRRSSPSSFDTPRGELVEEQMRDGEMLPTPETGADADMARVPAAEGGMNREGAARAEMRQAEMPREAMPAETGLPPVPGTIARGSSTHAEVSREIPPRSEPAPPGTSASDPSASEPSAPERSQPNQTNDRPIG